MTNTLVPSHISADQKLARSRWYGPNLLTFLSTADETKGSFTLIRCVLRKGFEPPLHVHTREDESYFILEGEIVYEAAEQRIHAMPGDFVLLPKSIPHTFTLISDTATLLLWITPSGFEEMFMQFSRPALSLELPPVPTEMPGKDFFDKMNRLNESLGVTMIPSI